MEILPTSGIYPPKKNPPLTRCLVSNDRSNARSNITKCVVIMEKPMNLFLTDLDRLDRSSDLTIDCDDFIGGSWDLTVEKGEFMRFHGV